MVDVARHMDDVTGARHEAGETVGMGLGALGTIRCFDEMDVEMDRAGVIRLRRQDSFEELQGAGGPALRFMPARLPIIPWLGDHGRLGGQHGNLKIVGIFVGKERHRIGKGGIERRALGSLIVRIAKRQRSDQCALLVAGRAGEGLRLARRCERAGALASGAIGTLMLGPSTNASPK